MKSLFNFQAIRNRVLSSVAALAVLTIVAFSLQACGGNGDELVSGVGSTSLTDLGGCSTDTQLETTGSTSGSQDLWESKKVIFTFVVSTDASGNLVLADLNNVVVTTTEFNAKLQQLPKDGVSAIELRIADEATMSEISPDQVQTDWEYTTRVGCYFLRISWEKHDIRSCINRNVWHLGILLKNTCSGRDITNIHACAWWQNGPQVGLYDSFNGWCVTTVGTFTAIREKLKVALAIVGITGFTAYIISSVGATVIVGAFAL
ncbi:hypothetical protein HY844_02395 [Candidatus Berkelbacteria bacterium]|nr:hypothetical protein [Candidatus Berkelbacteria bacterium]